MVSPLRELCVSIDARTLNDSLRKPIRSIDPSGSLIYAHQRNPNDKRTEYLERIWNEYPSGLLELSEEELRGVPPETRFDDNDDEEEEGRRPVESKDLNKEGHWGASGSNMTSEDMEALRSEVFAQLNTARNELWYVLELAKTLSLSSGFTNNPPLDPNTSRKIPKRPALPDSSLSSTEAPILPPGTYSTTPSVPPSRSQIQDVLDLDAALRGKKRALDECEALIDAAIDEMGVMATAGERFWDDVRRLRDGVGSSSKSSGSDPREKLRGQWAVVPKPDFGRTMTEGEKAKDVVIPYALDEAPQNLRARSLAAFDLDPHKAEALTFGTRTFLRLRATLTSGLGTTLQSSQIYDAREEDKRDVVGLMQAAQRESIDEELFNEIRGESVRLDNTIVEDRRVLLKVGHEELVFEMYDSSHPPSETSISATCDLILSSARLGLLNQHRRRKSRIIHPPTISGPIAPISILVPIIQTILFYACCSKLQPVLNILKLTLGSAGVRAEVDTLYSTADTSGQDTIKAMLIGGSRIDGLGAVITMSIEKCPGITLNVTAPSSVSVTTSVATFPLKDSDYLPVALADDIGSQLTRWAFNVLQDHAKSDIRQHIVFDDLECTILVSNHGTMTITIPPPFDTVSVGGDHSFGTFDPRSGQNLIEWLEQVACRIQAPC